MVGNDYKIGYRKPPKGTRFKQGTSGNPNGRPKGSRNFKTDVKETLESPVHFQANGQTKTIPTRRAALERLRVKALKGDARSLDRLLELARIYDDDDIPDTATSVLAPSDEAILDNFLRRHGASPPERPNEQSGKHRSPPRKRKRLHE